MPRKANDKRNAKIRAAVEGGMSRTAVAAKYHVSREHTYRIAPANAERFETTGAGRYNPMTGQSGDDAPNYLKAGGPLFDRIASTGVRRFAQRVLDDYDRVFTNVYQRVQLFREMGDDPSIAAVLNAIRFTFRSVSWYADSDGDTDSDKKAVEFLETNMDDMAGSWSDTIDQAVNCVQYGFQVAETTYKRRSGPDPKKITVKDIYGQNMEVDAPPSKYDDGKIGWREWVMIAPESLSPGREWEFDDYGTVKMVYQLPPPDYIMRELPMDKAILFRSTTEKNNPEGRALLRPMWSAWWFKHNLEEIEAISAERMGAGIPVVYLGDDVPRNLNDANSDAAQWQTIVRNLRTDEQAGVVIPYPKMGGGAAPGRGVLLELLAPTSRGIVNFQETITRYEQRIAMIGLAQFIHLGLTSAGARAQAQANQDFFTAGVEGWADMIADQINRQAVDRLFRINAFPGITAVPQIKHQSIRGASLQQMADYVNKLALVNLLTPGPELENYLRDVADLPALPAEIAEAMPNPEGQGQAAVGGGDLAPADAGQEDTKVHETGGVSSELEPAARKATAGGRGGAQALIGKAREQAQRQADQASLTRAAEELTAEIRRARSAVSAERFSHREAPPAPTINIAMPEQKFNMPAQTFNVQQPPAPSVAVTVPELRPQVSVNVPQGQAPNVYVTTPQPTVNVRPDIHVAAAPTPENNVVVNVSPTPVRVDNTVNVPPGAPPVVNVAPELKVPDHEETVDIERDPQGRMKRTTKRRKFFGL